MTDFTRKGFRGFLSMLRQSPEHTVHQAYPDEYEDILDRFMWRNPVDQRNLNPDEANRLDYIEFALRDALNNHGQNYPSGLLVGYRSNNLDDPTGALAYSLNEGRRGGNGPHQYVDWLGSNQPGLGTSLMKSLRDIDRQDIRLYATDEPAARFYESLGFIRPYSGMRRMLMPRDEPWHRSLGGYIP